MSTQRPIKGTFPLLALDDIPTRERLSHLWFSQSSGHEKTKDSIPATLQFQCSIIEEHNVDRQITLTVYADLGDPSLPVIVTDHPDETYGDHPPTSLAEIAKRLDIRPVHLLHPWPLSSIRIPKPWGEEIWFTGIEARGVSHVLDTPLHWLLHVAGDLFDTSSQPPLLLKILAPLSHNPKGDLYFELHEQKQEVYVVTQVDPEAWPDGVGEIRMGLSAEKRASFEGRAAFLRSFRDAIREYEHIRRQIDNGKTSGELASREQELRAVTETYTDSIRLKVGDVVQVPTLVPHSLRHGVRVVEFQTPHYERKIISFAQKVVTQNEWDTEDALNLVRTDVPETTMLLISDEDGNRCELICRFDAFEVYRHTLEPGACLTLRSSRYQIVIAITPGLEMAGDDLLPERALALPRSTASDCVNAGQSPAMLLVAAPLG